MLVFQDDYAATLNEYISSKEKAKKRKRMDKRLGPRVEEGEEDGEEEQGTGDSSNEQKQQQDDLSGGEVRRTCYFYKRLGFCKLVRN